jgi:hypothetical protein
MALLPTIREKLVVQYAAKATNPAVKSGLRFPENITPISSPNAEKNSVSKSREFATRKTSKPGWNRQRDNADAPIKDMLTVKTPHSTVRAFAQNIPLRVCGFVNRYSDVFPENSLVWIDIPKCIPKIPEASIKKLVRKE